MGADLRAGGMDVVGQASASHRLADVERGPAAGHRVDDQGAGGRVVVERMGHQGGRDGAGVGDAEGPIVAERPDVVRRGAEVGAEAVATAEVLVGGMDRLGSGVELGDAAPSPGVARAGRPPDGSGLPVEVLAAHPEVSGDRRIRPAPAAGLDSPVGTCLLIKILVRRPERRNSDIRRRRANTTIRIPAPPQVRQPTGAGLRSPELFEGVGFAHQLTECLAALAVVFEDRTSTRGTGREPADLARDLGQTEGQRAGQTTMPGKDLPGPRLRSGSDDHRDEDSVLADARQQVIDLGRRFAVKR